MEKLVTKKQLQELLDVSLSALNKYISVGLPVAVQGGNGNADASKFNLADVKAWLNANVKTKNEEMFAAKLRKMEAEAATAEIELDLLRGRVIPIEDVVAVVGNDYTVIRQNVGGIGPRYCYELAALGSDPIAISERLTSITSEILEGLTADELYSTPTPVETARKRAKKLKDNDE